jgi:hypothetical protein
MATERSLNFMAQPPLGGRIVQGSVAYRGPPQKSRWPATLRAFHLSRTEALILRTSKGYCPSCSFICSSILRLTASRLKEAGACIGG